MNEIWGDSAPLWSKIMWPRGLQSGLTMNRVGSFDDCVQMPLTVACNDCDLRGPHTSDCDFLSLVCDKDHWDNEWRWLWTSNLVCLQSKVTVNKFVMAPSTTAVILMHRCLTSDDQQPVPGFAHWPDEICLQGADCWSQLTAEPIDLFYELRYLRSVGLGSFW